MSQCTIDRNLFGSISLPFKLLLAVCISLLASPCLAEEETPWYQVEVIVFTQQDIFREETNRRDIPLEFPDNMVLLQETAERTRSQSPPLPALLVEPPAPLEQLLSTPADKAAQAKSAFVSLGNKERHLKADAYSLNRTGVYKVLYHQAWRQPGLGDKQAAWVYLAGGESFDGHRELEGSLRLVKARYLHVQVRLWRTLFELITNGIAASAGQVTDTDPGSTRQQLPWPPLPDAPKRPEDPRLQQLRDLVEEYKQLEAEQAALALLEAQAEETDSGAWNEDAAAASAATSGSNEAVANTEEAADQQPSGQDIFIPESGDDALATGEVSMLEESLSPSYEVVDIDFINQTQRVDTSNIFYFDHPRIGVLVKVSEYELPENEAPEPVSG